MSPKTLTLDPAVESAYAKLQAAALEITVASYLAKADMARAIACVQEAGALALAGDAEWYQAEASRTSACPDGVDARLAKVAPLLHAAIGLATEAGELLDALKKHVWYGTPLDRTTCLEEAGDVAWYLAEACTALDVPMREVFIRNISKLRKRYGGRFTAEAATRRDVPAERAAMRTASAANIDAVSAACPPSGMTVSAWCRESGFQACHVCDDLECGDNRTAERARQRQEAPDGE